jgi:integral membrane protein
VIPLAGARSQQRTLHRVSVIAEIGGGIALAAPDNLDSTTWSLGDEPMRTFKTSLGRLRIIGWWEGVSFLVLLGIAMPLKYLAGWPDAVRVVGMAHGILFILYVVAAIQAALEYDWPWKRTALVLAASILPAGPFVVDAKLLRDEQARRAGA